MTNILKWQKLFEDVHRCKNTEYGFRADGRLIVGSEKLGDYSHKNIRFYVYYLGNVNKDYYYYKRRELPKKRSNIFN